jgi:hypothetical protein
MASRIPPNQLALARTYGSRYGVDPRVLLAIAGHETEWGTTGAGRPSQGGYALGYGVTDSGILSKYAGLANQYRYAAQTLAGWGVHGIQDILGGKASRYATDPGWERGVAGVYSGIGGNLGGGAPPSGAPPTNSRTMAMAAPPRAIPSHVLDIVNQSLAGQTSAAPTDGAIPGHVLDAVNQHLMQPLKLPKFVGRLPAPPVAAAPAPNQAQQPSAPVSIADWKKWVTPSSTMDRSGVATNPAVFQTVAKIAQVYGQKLTIGTGSNHREFVNNDPHGHQSDHWFGEAADIPMAGTALTRLGQAALIAAGADPKWARQQSGGVFNIGGLNILFNTHVGGNHFNHLHVGLGRILGRHF